MTEKKLKKLDAILKDLRSLVVAFSGGVDSSFLLHRAHTLGNINVTGVTVQTPYMPIREINEATDFASRHSIPHRIIDAGFPEVIQHNPVNRCYLCKKKLFSYIESFALDNGYKIIADGTNLDDTSEYRPGLKALKELGIISPLADAGLTKKDIRELSHKAGLPFWDKPAMACLLTRIPYDTEINTLMLGMIEKAEDYLLEKGYPGTRVRLHGDIARIECMPGYLEKIINDPHREQIVATIRNLGFRYISLDLEGYRTGSMNPEIEKL